MIAHCTVLAPCVSSCATNGVVSHLAEHEGGANILLRLLTIRLTYRIANTLWEPRMPPIFCGIKGNGLLLIIKPQSRFDSSRMSVLASSQRQQILCTD